MSDDLRPSDPELLVLQFADGWGILTGSGRWGCFNDGCDAEAAARRLKDQALRSGQGLRILVQCPTGELRPLDVT